MAPGYLLCVFFETQNNGETHMKYVAIAVALAVSTLSAYFSVLGMKELFPKYITEIIALTVLLEMAKVTTAVYLHQNWEKVTGLVKVYLTVAVITLAGITSLGVYSFLMKSHVENIVTINQGAAKELAISEIEKAKLASQLAGIESRLNLTTKSADKKIDNSKKAADADLVGSPEENKLRELQNEKTKLVGQIAELDKAKIDQLNAVKSEAAVFSEVWFNMFIFVLVVFFDPLAIALLMLATSLDVEETKISKILPKNKRQLAKKKPKRINSKPKKTVNKRKIKKKTSVITIRIPNHQVPVKRGRPSKNDINLTRKKR